MNTRINNVWTQIRSSLWLIPAVLTASVIALAFLTLFVDRYSTVARVLQDQWLFTIGPQGARTLMATVAGSVIGIAGVSFSITIVALTLASSQFGPRLLNNFMKDMTNQMVLGIFIATFIYGLLVLGAIRESEAHVFVPQISIKVGIVLTFISLGTFIYFIHHISASIHAETIMTDVSHDLEKSIMQLFPEKVGHDHARTKSSATPSLPQNFEQHARSIVAPSSGYLQAIDHQEMLALATEHDLLIYVQHRPGEFIVTHETLARIWPPHHKEDALLRKIAHTFLIGSQRTDEQDVEFALHQLVEIALRALSPGINDPFTAIGCIDRLGGCLSLLSDRTLPSGYRYDETNTLRVVAHPITMDGIFDAAFNQICQDGGACVAVGLRLLETFGVLASRTNTPTMQAPIRRHAQMVKDEMSRRIQEEADLQEVEKRYEEIQKRLSLPEHRS
ncbi:MAG: hypothetical protein NPIRA02_07830 [Nitrospirales bacterium]|nr:MAG: hypothetical protein NPIRA02_07830 [Nitrospirales bacterium]